MRQIEGIDADAVAADQAGRKCRKFHLVRCGVQHVVDRDAEPAEDHRHFVDEGDVDVALRVLDHLGGFGHLDVAAR